MALIPRLILFSLVYIFFSSGAFSQVQPIQIMPLGNSISQGNTEHPSYRYPLWEKLVKAGIEFKYVGSHTVNNNGPSPKTGTVLNGKTFDNRNEAHWGWSADQILNGRNGEGKLVDWLQNYTPDMVLMHVGTNDMFLNHSVTETLDELREIVRLLRVDNPNVTIFMAKLIPAYDQKVGPQAANNIKLLNEKIPALSQELHSAKSAVILVDQFSDFNPIAGADTWDGIHPNASGEEKMARKWFNAIMEKLSFSSSVTYSKFEGSLTKENDIQLDWVTSSEKNNTTFEIHRALKGGNFASVGQIAGAGNSSVQTTYSFTDRSAPIGELLYKLKQIGTDGSSSYSDTISIKKDQVLSVRLASNQDDSKLQVYPTVSTDKTVTVDLQHQKPFSDVELAILTSEGKLIYQFKKQCTADGILREKLYLHTSEKAGLYLLRVLTNDLSLHRRFIISN